MAYLLETNGDSFSPCQRWGDEWNLFRWGWKLAIIGGEIMD
jgi:hypothetical protein